jgi:hypothetical protein
MRGTPDEGRIVLVYGRLGAGKTAYLVKRARSFARLWKLPVYANSRLRPDWEVVRNWVELRELPLTCVECSTVFIDKGRGDCPCCGGSGRHPAVIVLDEVHLWMPSMPGLMPGEQVRLAVELLSFARKRGWVIVATSQAITRVNTAFRQLMTELVRVRPLMDGMLHVAELQEVDPPHRTVWNWYGLYRPKAGGYDTRATVTPLWSKFGSDGGASVVVREAPGSGPGLGERPEGRQALDAAELAL